jgi:Flp pilus assembly secretin CpaC
LNLLGELHVRFIPVFLFLVGALLSASVSAEEPKNDVLTVAPGASRILRTDPGVHTVIIGNPAILDGSMVGDGVISITGKAAGWTNMILLDDKHAVILQTDVQIAEQIGPKPRTIQVIHGDKVQDYSCTSACNLAPKEVTTASGSFRNCDEARAAGATSIRRGQPGYAPHLDSDNDGIGCE